MTAQRGSRAQDRGQPHPGGPRRPAPTVLLFSEARLHPGPDGGVRAIDLANGPAAWGSHQERLPGARLAARVGPPDPRAEVPLGDLPVHPLPYFHRPAQLLRRLPAVASGLWRAVGTADFSVLRLPGVVSLGAGTVLRLRRRPYAVELVGDPVTLLTSGAVGPLGAALAPAAGALTRWVVRGASLGRYVTARTLQQAYPLRPGAPAHHYSNVVLAPSDFAPAPRATGQARRLVAVGTQDQMYKGHDDLLRALALLDPAAGFELTLIGDGRCHEALRRLATTLGVADRVRFLGRVNDRGRLWAELDRAEIFVQPSRTEGLPRALIEAMARGLPAVGTAVGGIPELLGSSFLVPPGRPDQLAVLLETLAGSAAERSAASRTNLAVARRFDSENQEERVRGWLDALAEVVDGGEA